MDERIDSRNLDLDIPEDKALYDELEENCDENPMYGITLVRKDKFVEYAQDYADDMGAFSVRVTNPRTYREENYDLSQQWPFNHIDWKEAADELAVDWYEVEYKGTTYLAR